MAGEQKADNLFIVIVIQTTKVNSRVGFNRRINLPLSCFNFFQLSSLESKRAAVMHSIKSMKSSDLRRDFTPPAAVSGLKPKIAEDLKRDR